MKRIGSLALTVLLVLVCALVLLRSDALLFGKEAVPRSELPAVTEPPQSDPAEAYLAEMSREEKLWQLIVVFPQKLTGDNYSADPELWAESLLARPAGGIVFDGDNMRSEPELRVMLAAAEHAAAARQTATPFLCVDEEGGAVARVAYNLGVTTKFSPMYAYREDGAGTAFENAFTIGSELREIGFNVDFAPVADVWTNPDNTVIGKRAYSDDPQEAATLVAGAVRGFHSSGMLCVLKHFPGHGDTAEDSHLGAAYCGKTPEELRRCEFLPFEAGIAAGAGMVMVGHITLNEVDPDAPATLSKAVVTGLLREELGFRDGVVITDAMSMSALAGLDETEAAVRAVEAGCDLLLGLSDPDAAVQALDANLSDARLDESVLRILRLKAAHGLLPLE